MANSVKKSFKRNTVLFENDRKRLERSPNPLEFRFVFEFENSPH